MSKKYLDQILKLCTPSQLDMFNRMYPDGPAPKQINTAISQVERTILSLNHQVEKLKDIDKAFEEFKEAAAARESAHVRGFQHLTKELADVLKENERLSASPVNVNNADIIEQLDKLAALEAAGVDNWEWYGEALSSMNDED
jgi:hypothetical protein